MQSAGASRGGWTLESRARTLSPVSCPPSPHLLRRPCFPSACRTLVLLLSYHGALWPAQVRPAGAAGGRASNVDTRGHHGLPSALLCVFPATTSRTRDRQSKVTVTSASSSLHRPGGVPEIYTSRRRPSPGWWFSPSIPNGSRLWPPEVLSAGLLSAGAL